MADVNGPHADLGPELRQLAQAILDRLDPAVRTAAAMAAGRGDGPGRCQQVWCPVCALAALVAGEHHPLLSVIAEHSVALMTVIRAMVADIEAAGNGDRPPEGPPEPPTGPPGPEGDRPPPGPGRYQHIPITVEE
ncbi:hypothetical protein KEK_06237 [Mycolicibacterium thermoresistibile ATCC 19527]|uniref:Uncharacterized protein n=2 Tax=Mycolicibacterium thermoresistibile TaxID=1797 RepID=G7CE39_MYCT3|nr:hypothetical protein KEK_06237 [Mycolicibacterium thermoresistibile ATCC 19527]GAT16921.1 putative uncharacterized protein [Mycolicibacterium thermoresistibile]